MADTVLARLLADGVDSCVVHLTGISDATGEAAVKKVDITTVAKTLNAARAAIQPVALDIEAVRWSIQGYKSIRLLWDHTVDDTALVLAAGSGYEDFGRSVGNRTQRDTVALLTDPRSAGADGSVLLTSDGAAAGATYDITLWLKKANA